MCLKHDNYFEINIMSMIEGPIGAFNEHENLHVDNE